jgi:hypothetical protein
VKAADFKPCALCGKGMMHAGVPLFYRVTVEHMGIDVRECERASGMEQFLGNVALARVFHDPDVAQCVGEPVTTLVCQSCALTPSLLARLAEGAAP